MSEILTKQRRIGERLSRYNILRFDIAALPYDGQECPSYIISLRPPHSFQSRNMQFYGAVSIAYSMFLVTI